MDRKDKKRDMSGEAQKLRTDRTDKKPKQTRKLKNLYKNCKSRL